MGLLNLQSDLKSTALPLEVGFFIALRKCECSLVIKRLPPEQNSGVRFLALAPSFASEDEVDSRRTHNPVVADSSSAAGTRFIGV